MTINEALKKLDTAYAEVKEVEVALKREHRQDGLSLPKLEAAKLSISAAISEQIARMSRGK